MKYMTTVAALLILTATSTAFASPKPSAKAQPLVCPVTGETIASVKAAVGHSVYKGKTYYFCCSGCKPLFDANPAKYVKSASAAKSKPKMMSM
jgi:Cu+-exporting ATPase